jgi:hypothetical protein
MVNPWSSCASRALKLLLRRRSFPLIFRGRAGRPLWPDVRWETARPLLRGSEWQRAPRRFERQSGSVGFRERGLVQESPVAESRRSVGPFQTPRNVDLRCGVLAPREQRTLVISNALY